MATYSKMMINPNIDSWCNPNSLASCPPYHTFPNGTQVHPTDKNNYPYEAYHVYRFPGNVEHLEEPYNYCDPCTDPQPQEILQILPHPDWGDYGYPTKKGKGWIGDPRTWELDVGRLSRSFTSTRIQAPYLQKDTGHRSTWEPKNTEAIIK